MRVIQLVLVIVVLFVSGIAQKKMSDVEFDGFNGRVKSVTEESEWVVGLSDGEKTRQRQIMAERLYDKHGNLKEYTNSRLFKQVFSFIDGFKTYKHQELDTTEEYGRPPAPAPFGRGDLSKNPSDPRFTVRFEYKYDSKGRVSEEIRYLSNGSLLIRDVRQYDPQGNDFETKSYFGEIMRRIERRYYDAKRNLILTTSESPSQYRVTSTYVRRFGGYQLDAKGNWIQRTEITVETNGDTLVEREIIRRRTISYY